MCEKILLSEIKHLGAKGCVTGSCHLLQRPNGVNILVDCGKAYGNDPEIPFDKFPVSPGDIDYLFLTHAYIDHIGRVSDLIDTGFRREIIGIIAGAIVILEKIFWNFWRQEKKAQEDIQR